MNCDFSGYATKVNLRCSDGRTILKDAFKGNDGGTVPLVWQHQRNNPENVLGHALLENRDDGVYAYCTFNETENGQLAKALVEHGDITQMSIFANRLVETPNRDVKHGVIREVSLVYAGANPGALIDNVYVQHGEDDYEEIPEEAVIYTGVNFSLEHADKQTEEEETIEDIFNTLTDKQKNVVYAMIGYALDHSDESGEEDDEAEHSDDEADDSEEPENIEHSDEGGNEDMKKNIFDTQGTENEAVLSHDELSEVLVAAKRSGAGSLREVLISAALEHGITNIDTLFPEAKAVNVTPEMIMRDQEWVSKVWNATRKSPFSRIKSTAADLTKDEARAKGYIKGKRKEEEQFALLKRVTTPQTIYKKQALDRDDVVDITDFEMIAWLRAEMRLMLNEELARAILIGDGRTVGAEDKINETNIRPVFTDVDMYTIHYPVVFAANATDDEKADTLVTAAHRARKNYKGSGSPTAYMDPDTLTTMLLAKDKIGRRLYNTMSELASAIRVKEIVEVPVMEDATREAEGKTYHPLMLVVNLTDYVVGADKGGAVNMFDDFDIDYNRMKYLIETRCSGALVKPYSAISIEVEVDPS